MAAWDCWPTPDGVGTAGCRLYTAAARFVWNSARSDWVGSGAEMHQMIGRPCGPALSTNQHRGEFQPSADYDSGRASDQIRSPSRSKSHSCKMATIVRGGGDEIPSSKVDVSRRLLGANPCVIMINVNVDGNDGKPARGFPVEIRMGTREARELYTKLGEMLTTPPAPTEQTAAKPSRRRPKDILGN